MIVESITSKNLAMTVFSASFFGATLQVFVFGFFVSVLLMNASSIHLG